MFDKISPAQFWFIYCEITGDNNKSENNKQAEEYNERIKVSIKNSDESSENNAKKNKVQ